MLEDTPLNPVNPKGLDRQNNYCVNTQQFLVKAEVLCSKNLHGDSFYKYLSNRIKYLNLHGTDFRDIISEAVIRGVDYINSNQQAIDNPKAWIRVTTSNILLEKVREAKKYCQPSNDFLEIYDSSNDFNLFNDESGESLSENPTKALKAFHHLSKPERRIITYKLFQGKSYREISNLSAYQNCTEATLRQQYSRAIKNLRKGFNDL